jgi:ABC-type polysaccharide/polyol phosphate transport system ATPase subunit
MPDAVIHAERLGVKFAKNPERVVSLKELYLRLWNRAPKPEANGHFWVLRNLSFELHARDILGVIGRNGAGKSTLLRVLAGMIPPDEGSAAVRGRPLLLTPGIGFRDELTGRDNIAFGGLYLGLTRREIDQRVEGIVDFSELREAIDRPFKYYSDGMKARLIFSVATSVDPDILMLDELLSAGDAGFQQKAQARMDELIGRARTIVAVTHNLTFVRKRCTQALYLDRGEARFFGDPNAAVDRYLADLNLPTSTP